MPGNGIFLFSVYLKQVVLICRSEKIPIENVRVFLKNRRRASGRHGCVYFREAGTGGSAEKSR